MTPEAPGLFRKDGPATSKTAAFKLDKATKLTHLLMLFRAYSDAGERGLTDAEGMAITGLDYSSFGPRRRDLKKSREVVDSGVRRKTPSGRDSIVWRLAAFEGSANASERIGCPESSTAPSQGSLSQ